MHHPACQGEIGSCGNAAAKRASRRKSAPATVGKNDISGEEYARLLEEAERQEKAKIYAEAGERNHFNGFSLHGPNDLPVWIFPNAGAGRAADGGAIRSAKVKSDDELEEAEAERILDESSRESNPGWFRLPAKAGPAGQEDPCEHCEEVRPSSAAAPVAALAAPPPASASAVPPAALVVAPSVTVDL